MIKYSNISEEDIVSIFRVSEWFRWIVKYNCMDFSSVPRVIYFPAKSFVIVVSILLGISLVMFLYSFIYS